MKKSISKNRYRFPRVGFGLGFGSAFDISGALTVKRSSIYRNARTPSEADALALAGDWAMVGQYIQTAIDKIEQETAKK